MKSKGYCETFTVECAGQNGREIVVVLINYNGGDPPAELLRKRALDDSDQTYFGAPGTDRESHAPLIFVVAVENKFLARGPRFSQSKIARNAKRRTTDWAASANQGSMPQPSNVSGRRRRRSRSNRSCGSSASRDDATRGTTSRDSMCVICFAPRRNTHACVPCGHRCLCNECAASVSRCPLCRRDIERVLQIFG